VGKQYQVDVEKGHLKFFAETIGETNPIYFDEASAQRSGYPGILAPPTFLFTLSLYDPDPGSEFRDLKVDPSKVLHAAQSFRFEGSVFAGDTITFKTQLVDIYTKKDGLLEFFVNRITASNQSNKRVAVMENTCVVRQGIELAIVF